MLHKQHNLENQLLYPYNYKYLHDNSIVENDYIEDILTNKKKGKKLFSDKDKYGNTSLNYLRDIKSILLNGIRVFVTNDYPQSDDDSSDPRIQMSDINEDYRRDMRDEEEELRKRTRRENRLDQTNENRRTLKEIIKPDPEFKRPEITTPKHNEEEEWAVVTKKGKVKKIKSE